MRMDRQTVVMDEEGCITLPAETLADMGWKPGQSLRLTVVGNEMVIEASTDVSTDR